MADTITSANFDEKTQSGVTLIDFWAPWCGPCRALSPVIDALAKEYEGKATIAKVNTDEEAELAAKFSVMAIPSIFILKDGKQVARLGPASKADYAKALDAALKA